MTAHAKMKTGEIDYTEIQNYNVQLMRIKSKKTIPLADYLYN